MPQLKYIAHVTRHENSSLQMQFHFARRLRVHQRNGKKFSELTMLDESQLRLTMFDKTEFQKFQSNTKERLDSESNPMWTSASNG